MNSAIKLQRFGRSTCVPAPNAIRASDYVYTTSIYPIDKSGHAIGHSDKIGTHGRPYLPVPVNAG
jgi:hypothetical protein